MYNLQNEIIELEFNKKVLTCELEKVKTLARNENEMNTRILERKKKEIEIICSNEKNKIKFTKKKKITSLVEYQRMLNWFAKDMVKIAKKQPGLKVNIATKRED